MLFFYKRPETTKEKLIAEMECKKGKENFRKIIEMVSEKTKLKPCPFCNGKAILEESKFGFNHISCESCGARIASLYLPDAIEAWNKRVDVSKTDECCEKSCKEENTTLPSWTYFEWNHQFNFSACSIYISQSVCLDFTVRRANNDLNTDKWEAYSELVNCVHDTQLSEEQIIFGVSRKEAIEKCNDAIKQMCNGFLELCNKNRKVENHNENENFKQ